MPYYVVGDYYGRGDYYQGDGILSSIGHAIGGIAKVGIGAIGGLITGGPKGAITGAIGAGIGVAKQGIQRETLAAGGSETAYTPALMEQHAAAVARGVVPAIAAPAPMLMLGGGMLAPGMGLMVPRGYRPNKSTYAVRGGGTSRWGPAGMVRIIPKGTVPVKSRRMNVANPRALRRGLRRAAGFVKLARRAHVKLTQFRGGGKKRKR